jgi:hypothetical protein
MKSRVVSRFLVVLLAGVCTSKLAAQGVPPAKAIGPEASRKSQLAEGYGRLPLSFEANKGQTNSGVKFLSRNAGQMLFLTSSEAVLVLSKQQNQNGLSQDSGAFRSRWSRSAVLRMRLLGASSETEVTGLERLPGTSNYFIGNDPARWHTDVPTYSKVRYSQIYPGIDLVYYGHQRQLEYDFVVAPGADPARIRLAIRGAGKLSIDADGNAVLRQKDSNVRLLKPHLYQEVRGQKVEIAGGYVLQGQTVRFEIGDYDHHQPLIIDPVLSYSTFLGGNGIDGANAVAVDSNGNAYITGSTSSKDFPGITSSSYQSTNTGGTYAFVAKLNATGSALVYSTYLGGGSDQGLGIAVDSSGNAYVTGETDSAGFPRTTNPILSSFFGPASAFLTELNPTGSALVYSTYLRADRGNAIAVDSGGNAFVTGWIQDLGRFPCCATSYFGTSGTTDVYVAKVNPTGSALVYSAYVGGTNSQRGWGIAVDSSGNAYVTGDTSSSNFPVTANSLQSTFGGASDAFALKLNPAGNALTYSTFIGGTGAEQNHAIAIDSSGAAYMTGNSAGIALAMKLDPTGSTLLYSTALTTFHCCDSGSGIAVDSSGNAYVTGVTGPTLNTVNPIQSVWAGGTYDAFVAQLDPTGNLVFNTYLGGDGDDRGMGIAVDPSGAAYVVGTTIGSANGPNSFPITAGALNSTLVNGSHAFVTKFGGSQAATSTTLSASANPSVFGQQVSFTATVAPTTSSSLTPTGNVTFNDASTVLGTVPLSSGTAIFNTSALAAGGHSITASYAGDSNFASSTSTALSQTVNQGTAMATITASPSPGILGQPLTLTVIVTPVVPATGTPTGTVNFLDGTTALGSGTLSGGQATFTTSSLTTGSHSITANYAGDTNFVTSTSSILSLAVKLATTTALITSPNPSNTGQSVLLTATVTFSGSSTNTPSGTITFLDGTTTLGTGTLSSGTATFSTSSLTAGAHNLTASYGSDTNFASSTSITVTQTVKLLITVNESITVSDAPTLLPSAMITVPESISVSDVPALLPSAMITVPESISVSDAPSISPAVQINVGELISVTDVPVVANTPTGPNIGVNPIDTTTGTMPVGVTFNSVTQAGITSLTTSSTGAPPPPGFQPGTPLVYYDISTSAAYTGPINICINITGIVFPGSALPHIFHLENGVWVDHTLSADMTNMIVCGSVTSLSPFAIFQAAVTATVTSITAPSITYGTPASVTVSVGSSGGTVSGSVSLSLDGGPAASSALTNGSAVFNLGVLNATSHSLSASFAAQGNFTASATSGTLSVGQAPLIITANPATRFYGAANPAAFSANFSGFVNGDSSSVLTGLLTCVPTATSNSPVGTYPIMCSGFSSPNYAISFVNGTLSVVPETTSLSVTISPSSIVVGQSTTVTVTLTAPDMVIPIDPSVLAGVVVTSPIVSDILTNNGACALVPSATPGIAACLVTLTAVEPNGRTLLASFPGTSSALAASTGTAGLIVTAPLESKVSCLKSDFRNVAAPGGSYLWFNSIFKVRDVTKQKVNITFFQSSVQFQYTDASKNLVTVNQALPDAKITIDPSISTATTTFDAVNNVWITTVPFDLDDASFLTGIPWLVPAGGIPGDIEPVTWCGTFASDTAGVDIGWRWSAAAYSSFSGDNTMLGVKSMNTDHDNPPANRDNAGTPENFKPSVIPGARGKGGKNYTGTYSGSAEIE